MIRPRRSDASDQRAAFLRVRAGPARLSFCGLACATRGPVNRSVVPVFDVFLDRQRPSVLHVFVEVFEENPVWRSHR